MKTSTHKCLVLDGGTLRNWSAIFSDSSFGTKASLYFFFLHFLILLLLLSCTTGTGEETTTATAIGGLLLQNATCCAHTRSPSVPSSVPSSVPAAVEPSPLCLLLTFEGCLSWCGCRHFSFFFLGGGLWEKEGIISDLGLGADVLSPRTVREEATVPLSVTQPGLYTGVGAVLAARLAAGQQRVGKVK